MLCFAWKRVVVDKFGQYSFENIYDPQSTPAVDGDYVYALSQTGIMVCVKKER